jgi:hypothetical protein
MFSGASGLGSQVSIWLAPPYWHTKMHERARAGGSRRSADGDRALS